MQCWFLKLFWRHFYATWGPSSIHLHLCSTETGGIEKNVDMYIKKTEVLLSVNINMYIFCELPRHYVSLVKSGKVDYDYDVHICGGTSWLVNGYYNIFVNKTIENCPHIYFLHNVYLFKWITCKTISRFFGDPGLFCFVWFSCCSEIVSEACI